MKKKNDQDDGTVEEFPIFDYEVPDSDTVDESNERNQSDGSHVEHLQRETDEALLRLDGRMQSYERQSIEKSQVASTRALTLSGVNLVLLVVVFFFGASLYSTLGILEHKNTSVDVTGLAEEQNNLSDKIQWLSEQVDNVVNSRQAGSDSGAGLTVMTQIEARLSQLEDSAKNVTLPEAMQDTMVITQPVTGQWIVSLFSFKGAEVAQQQAAELFDQGIQVAISAVEVQGATWYRLYLGGFTGKKDAEAYAEQARKALGFKLAWVTQVQ